MGLKQLLQLNNIQVDDSQCSTLASYCALIKEWNNKFNLTAILEDEEMYFKHIVDSLTASSLIANNAKVCDVGSGAGLPAIPLLLTRPDITVDMIDSVNKKVGFLQHCIDTYGLKATALHARVEDFVANHRAYFDVVTARAVAPLNTLCEYCLPLVKMGGSFIAYKGEQASEELATAVNAIKILGGRLYDVQSFTLTNGVETLTRNLIVIKKVLPTPNKYPRGKNKERDNPIV